MNDKQKKALEGLEKAFKKCKDANLVFHGMDSSIMAFDKKEHKGPYDKYGDLCSMRYNDALPDFEDVNTYETYYDSGGW